MTGANSQILDALNGNVLAGLATNAAGGAFTIEGGGVYTQTGASSVTNILTGGELKAGTIDWTGGAMNVSGTLDPPSLSVCASCKLAGSGAVVANVSSAGVVAPGTATAAGMLSIKGAYTQGATAELVIDLASATPGRYGVLDVSGNAALGGVVDFVATGGAGRALAVARYHRKDGGTAVPEPPTWLLALTAFCWLLTRRGWMKNDSLPPARATTAATRN